MIALRYFLGRDCPIRRQAIAAQPSGPREARLRARFPRAGLDGENDGVKSIDSASTPIPSVLFCIGPYLGASRRKEHREAMHDSFQRNKETAPEAPSQLKTISVSVAFG